MKTYENAPATKLLASHCAVCARPLCDALSVETGIGPVCREKHGFDQPDVAVDLVVVMSALAATLPEVLYLELSIIATDTRSAANLLVNRIAREQDGVHVAAMTRGLAALGFVKLAQRIADRIGATLTDDAWLTKARAEYKNIRARHDISAKAFDVIVRNMLPANATADEWVKAAKVAPVPCKRCACTGQFITRVENGVPRGPGGDCFRCNGKGYQTDSDARRNWGHDMHRGGSNN